MYWIFQYMICHIFVNAAGVGSQITFLLSHERCSWKLVVSKHGRHGSFSHFKSLNGHNLANIQPIITKFLWWILLNVLDLLVYNIWLSDQFLRSWGQNQKWSSSKTAPPGRKSDPPGLKKWSSWPFLGHRSCVYAQKCWQTHRMRGSILFPSHRSLYSLWGPHRSLQWVSRITFEVQVGSLFCYKLDHFVFMSYTTLTHVWGHFNSGIRLHMFIGLSNTLLIYS